MEHTIGCLKKKVKVEAWKMRNSSPTTSLNVIEAVSSCRNMAVQLLPECWDLVFEKLKNDAVSTEACYNTCQEWRDKLCNKRTEFLFQKVLPFLVPNLDKTSILTCRLVSKMWKEDVDEYRNNALNQRLLDESWSPYKDHTHALDHSFFIDYSFTSMSKVEKFITTFNDPRVVPFMSKCVCFNDVEDVASTARDSALFWLKIATKFLPLFGSKITHCEMVIWDKFGPRLLHAIIIAVLKYMPSLVHLTIANMEFDDSFDGLDNLIDQFDLSVNFQPRLEHLISLDVAPVAYETFGVLLTPICKDLVLNFYKRYHMPNVDLNLLTKLRVNATKEIAETLSGWSIENLEKLEIKAFCLNSLLKVTNKFGKTLRILKVNFTSIQESDLLNVRFQLPVLHTILLQVTKDMSCYDFMLPLTTLKHLTIIYTRYAFINYVNYEENLSILQIAGFHDHFYDSNAWLLLPSLTFVKIEHKISNCTWIYDRKNMLS